MNRGLLLKSAIETARVTLVFAAALAAVEGLIAGLIPNFFFEFKEALLQLTFVQRMIALVLGTDPSAALSLDTVQAFAWVHPLVLAILWAHAIWFCTRVPAGEIDHGTVDLLLTAPMSRTAILAHEFVAWVVAGIVLAGAALIGNRVGSAFVASSTRTTLGTCVPIAVNLYGMYLAVGGMVFVVSAASDHRGRAVGAALAIVLTWYLLNFVCQLWAPLEPLRFLGVLNYYRPLAIARDGVWPVSDTLILSGSALFYCTCAVLIFRRRDITVA